MPARLPVVLEAAVKLHELVYDLARDAGIPKRYRSAVVARARAAWEAVLRRDGYAILGAGLVDLARRVVEGAVRDFRRGVLEKRCV